MSKDIEALKREVMSQFIDERKRKGMTQNDLAAALNVNQNVISRVEKYDSNPKLDTLVSLAEAMGCEICLIDKSNGSMIKYDKFWRKYGLKYQERELTDKIFDVNNTDNITELNEKIKDVHSKIEQCMTVGEFKEKLKYLQVVNEETYYTSPRWDKHIKSINDVIKNVKKTFDEIRNTEEFKPLLAENTYFNNWLYNLEFILTGVIEDAIIAFKSDDNIFDVEYNYKINRVLGCICDICEKIYEGFIPLCKTIMSQKAIMCLLQLKDNIRSTTIE